MLKPLSLPQSLQPHSSAAAERLGVMCWNTQKCTLSRAFMQRLQWLMHHYPTQLLLLQEAKMPVGQRLNLAGLSWMMAPNIQTRRHHFGVVTASELAFEDATALLSQHRELQFATHKSVMLSEHLFAGERVLVANVHSVNFVHHRRFLAEMESLIDYLQAHRGPMVVAGDFNVWSRRRQRYLARFTELTGLRQAVMENPHHIKQVFRQPLDFIFYRGLQLDSATAIDTDLLSDHNPIYARFLPL
ncbi:endonuclease/exonuclease/phosphatase family protein [Gallaecimonas sp. GXIMD1310]|uniref:endonuclease/exonuclease/phosphatase family protein n=1 Tax=Gallaecimonas sp. GXIMD1310 TaxID=3131926 RepID=UPI00324B75B4